MIYYICTSPCIGNKDKEMVSQQLIQLRQQQFQQQLSTSGNQQPSSLPPDLSISGVDLHKLRELRRAVRDECEQLLARKELLQQDVVILARQLSQQQQLSTAATDSCHNNPVKRHHSSYSKRGSLDLKRASSSAAPSTQISANPNPSSTTSSSSSAPATSTAMSPAHAFSSLARAYKVHTTHHTFCTYSTVSPHTSIA